MKKSLFILATAAIALASCNNDVKIAENKTLGNNPQEIAFFPLAQKPARMQAPAARAAIADATYPDNQVMQVAAYAMPISSTWTAGGYFDKTPFNGTNATSWKGTPARYWPLTDAYVSFLAVTGVDAEDITFDQTEYSSVKHYASGAAVVYDAASFTAQGDLMYSGKQEQVIQSGNALSFPDDVDMTFIHALSWLQFNVGIPSSATYGDVIDITSIVVNGAYQTGTFTITNTGYNTAGDPTPTGEWGSFGAATATTVPSSSYTSTLPNDGTYAACGSVLLVPQASPTTSFTSFTINYQMNGKDMSYTYTPASTVLAQATKYIYNIKFTLTEIVIDPIVQTWSDGGTTVIDIPAAITAGSPYTINVPNTAGTYTFTISGLTATNTVSVAKSPNDETIITGAPSLSATTVPTNGKVAITFTIDANASAARNATITLTNETTAAETTVITISQAAGA